MFRRMSAMLLVWLDAAARATSVQRTSPWCNPSPEAPRRQRHD